MGNAKQIMSTFYRNKYLKCISKQWQDVQIHDMLVLSTPHPIKTGNGLRISEQNTGNRLHSFAWNYTKDGLSVIVLWKGGSYLPYHITVI